ncbi:hypothetical protein N0464_08475 [Pseudomonas aeruginosa]|nr:hypothetical protein [Pseudomonas aeruginosa]
MSMELNKANECTCPSGDGSLVHPCPAHPAVDQADVAAKLTFINGRPAMCGCQVEYSDGGGEYSDVIYVTLCAKHSGSAILDLVATNRIALTPEYEGQWHADLYLDREIPLAKVEGATPAEAVLALMSAERIEPEQESVEQAGGDERAAFNRWIAEQQLCQGSDISLFKLERNGALVSLHELLRDAYQAGQARAALAQPSQSQYEASFEEWLANELEGEDGQPVPAAVCDITLARRAFNHWPKLEQPAKVGGVRFSAGVSSRLVVEAAQRLYEFESTPEKEAERIERLQAFREQLDPLNLAPHAEAFNEAPDEALRPEQAEAERPEVVAYFDRNYPSTGDAFIWANYEGSPYEPVMTVAQHARIVGALRAENAKLSEDLNRLSIIRARLNLRLDFALDKISKLESRWPHGESPEERFEHYISNTIDRAPEPLRRLGNWLSHVLDEDQWTTAERMLTGACVAAEERAAAQTQHSVPIAPELKRALGLVVAALEADGDRPTSKYALSELKKVLVAAPGKEGM